MAIRLLRERVAWLDERCSTPYPGEERLIRFVAVMDHYNPGLTDLVEADSLVLTPDAADEIAGSCRLLARIAHDDPSLVTGPLARDAQDWVRDLDRRPGSANSSLTEAHFVSPRDRATIPPSTKPSLGLYTSTRTGRGRSMWRIYLESAPRKPDLLTQRIQPDETVVHIEEITRAEAWLNLLESYPRIIGDALYPDWHAIAREIDAVHLTLPAIAAIQGFRLLSGRYPGVATAPTFWDVESTLWLRWCFTVGG